MTGLVTRSEEHTSELQSPCNLVCRLLLEKKNQQPERDHVRTTAIPQRHWSRVLSPPMCLRGRISVWRLRRAERRLGGLWLFSFFNDAAPTEIYPLPLHAPLPI